MFNFDRIRFTLPFVLLEVVVRIEASLLASAPLSSSLIPNLVSAYEIVKAGLGFTGVAPLAVAVNGKGWREQTSLASTPAERSKAQNN